MKVLVLGAQGMLGKDLVPILSLKNQVLGRDVDDFDITDEKKVAKEIESLGPRIVVNAAAYTDVDGCEAKKDLAFSVNADAVRNIALGCKAIGARMIHLSTDYVFDGSSAIPYREEDPPAPLNVYGVSKLQGERNIREILENHLIIRTEWLYGRQGKNFVDTILRLAIQQEEIRVVNDQQGSPTFTRDLGWAIDWLLQEKTVGTIHVTNSGSCSWFEFARKILQGKQKNTVRIIPITSEELVRPAKRPANSVLDCSRFQQITGQKMRPWEEALKEYLLKFN